MARATETDDATEMVETDRTEATEAMEVAAAVTRLEMDETTGRSRLAVKRKTELGPPHVSVEPEHFMLHEVEYDMSAVAIENSLPQKPEKEDQKSGQASSREEILKRAEETHTLLRTRRRRS